MKIYLAVFPTCVGVNQIILPCSWTWVRLPHVRGGEPMETAPLVTVGMSSPRAWG